MPVPGTRALIHLALHAVVPLAVAFLWRRNAWRRTSLMLLAGCLIDVDHLLATPMYAPGRCSLAVHLLHSPLAIACYVAMLAPPRTRVLAVGLLIHIGLDGIDCMLMG